MKVGDFVLITRLEEGVWPGIDSNGDMQNAIGTVKKVVGVGTGGWESDVEYVLLAFPHRNYTFRKAWVIPYHANILSQEEIKRIQDLNI